MFGLQPFHVVLILFVALLVFGPARFGDIGRSVGSTLKEFRAATKETEPNEEVKK